MLQRAPADVEALEQLVRRMRGRKLPGERELAEQCGMSRTRLRAILDEFEARGLIARRQGSGTYALEEGSSNVGHVALLVDAQLKLGNDPFFSAVVERLQQVCQSEGIRCTLERVEADGRPVVIEDGVIAVGLATCRYLERLRRQDVPAVGLFVHATRPPGARLTMLDLDERGGGRRAAEQLRSLGCCKLFFVGSGDIPASVHRFEGARDASDGKLTRIETGMNYAHGFEAAAEVPVRTSGAPVGIIAANDWLALGLHTGLVNRGPDVRARVEIVSFDGLPITADPSLRIRSLAVPLDTMAEDTVSELRRLAASPVACGRDITYEFQ